jgi:hypothetical protein
MKISTLLRRLLVTANVVPTSPILITLMMETVRFCETSVLTRATRLTSQKTAFFNFTISDLPQIVKKAIYSPV